MKIIAAASLVSLGLLVGCGGGKSVAPAGMSSSLPSSSSSAIATSSSVDSLAVSSSLEASSSSVGMQRGEDVVYGTETYATVVIGTQTWFARNLNVMPTKGASWCYGGDTANCAKYGRLYDWAGAMKLASSMNAGYFGGVLPNQGVCPAGWHVPSDSEWTVLTDYLGFATAGAQLKGLDSA